jgi:ABC-type nitrate/sulfonate/bicarbonate transport system substrate-binding protein
MSDRKPFSGGRIPPEDCSIQQLVAQLRTAQVQAYLVSRGWVETKSGQADQRRFEVGMDDGDGVYELYLPMSTGTAKDHTRLMRNIYKLCGIEDREPAEIARDMVTTLVESESATESAPATKLRVRNSASSPLAVRVDSPEREYTLYPKDAIELTLDADRQSLEIERGDNSLTIHTKQQG